MIRIVITFLFLFISLFSHSQTEEIDYTKVSDENNQLAIELIKQQLIKPNGVLFGNNFYCGPNLWERYSEYDKISKIEKGNIIFEIPTGDKIVKREGKLIQTKEDYNLVWNQIIKDFSYSRIWIRKLNLEEIQYYWSIIFFKIHEPLFVIENSERKIIINLDLQGKILFLEEI